MADNSYEPFSFSPDRLITGQSNISSANAAQRQRTSFAGIQQSISSWPAAQSRSSPSRENPTPFSPPLSPSKLSDFFILNDEPQSRYSDWDVFEISRHLREAGHMTWSEAPRLYTVLRIIGQLQVLDKILDEGTSDIWFPFNSSTVPKHLSSSLRAQFLEVQILILTKAVDLEKNDNKRHTHFGREDAFPFEVKEKLGKGGSGTVDKIFSPFSRREFARKRFLRGGSHESKGEIQSFKTELQALKRIEHHHCIELVASYTDIKYFGLILSPVADCNLAEFYNQVSEGPENLNLLRQFFGCLATGLQYLHGSKIRHRDIKPENILIKSGCVYLADFGISLDWYALTRSTTTEDAGKSWIYCAPEVANPNHERRNSATDIWSLGCVFLEMCSILKGRTLHDMRQYFKKIHDTYKFYQCFRAIQAWSEDLWKLGSESDNLPLYWAALMMHLDPGSRPSANDLRGKFTKRIGKTDSEFKPFCGECCYIGSDADSSHGSASGGDLWAENLDDEITSPATSPLISPLTTDSSRRKAESGTEDIIMNKNSNHLSSIGHPTAVPKAILEPETPTMATPTISMGAHARATEAFVTETHNKGPDELPVTAYQEAVESASQQESVRAAAVPHIRYPMIGQNFQSFVETSSNEACSLSGSENVSNTGSPKISKAHDKITGDTLVDLAVAELERGSITTVPDEMGNNSNTKGVSKTDQTPIETAMGIDVQPPMAVVRKPFVTALISGSWMTIPISLFSKDRRTQTLSRRMPNGDAVLEETSGTVVDNDQMQSSSSGGMLTREVPERSQTIQPLPERPPPIPPNMTTKHRKSIEISSTDENNASILAEEVSASPVALPWMTASGVTSMPRLTSVDRAASIPSLNSLYATPGSSEHPDVVDTSGMSGIGEWTNEETQTNRSREGGKEGGGEEDTKVRSFPFIKAESWRSPGQFVGDVIKHSALIKSYEVEDLSRLISEKDPQSITTLVVRMIGDGLPINTNVYTDADGLTPLTNVLNWGEEYQALFELMVDAGAFIDEEKRKALPILVQAAHMGRLGATKFLVKAAVTHKLGQKWLALFYAAKCGHLDVVKYLIEEANSSFIQEPIMVQFALHSACRGAQLSVVKYLLENYRKVIDIEASHKDYASTDHGTSKTPLIHAYFNKRPFPDRLEVIKVLLEHGADPNGGRGMTTGHWSLLHFAAEEGQIELVKLLLKYPVKISTRTIPLFSGSLLGDTPIKLAKENGHNEIVELLQAVKKARKTG